MFDVPLSLSWKLVSHCSFVAGITEKWYKIDLVKTFIKIGTELVVQYRSFHTAGPRFSKTSGEIYEAHSANSRSPFRQQKKHREIFIQPSQYVQKYLTSEEEMKTSQTCVLGSVVVQFRAALLWKEFSVVHHRGGEGQCSHKTEKRKKMFW